MQWVKAGCHFHALRFLHGRTVSKQHTGGFQRWSAVWKTVFYNKVLWAFRVDERGNIGLLCRHNYIHAADARFFQFRPDCIRRARCNLVNHGPRESDKRFIPQISGEILVNQAVFRPLVCDLKYGCFKLFSVVGAVVHTDKCNGQPSGAVTLIGQGTDFGHHMLWCGWAVLQVTCNIRQIIT